MRKALSLGCLILSSTCSAQTWTQVKPATSPPARWSHSTSYDFLRGHTLLFGGTSSANSYMNDTWAYDGKTWTQFKPKNSPPGRRVHTMVHAGTHTVLFGGWTSRNGKLNDTWVWDGKDWTQIKTTNAPAPRGAAALAYDSARHRVVLFGGIASGNFGDTWEFDFKNWTQIKTKNSPSARYTNIAYDSARKRIVLFGGWGTSASPIQDTWEYDGKDWTKMNPRTQPSARVGIGTVYDAARQRTVIFGGLGPRFVYLGDTWEYDGNNWTQMKPTPQPPARYDLDHTVYDPRRRRIVMFGGLSPGARFLGDTWEYVAPQSLTGSPSAISLASGGTHTFSLDAGTANASRLYWIFGSLTGTSPGVTLVSAVGSVTIPLNPDPYTDITIALANTALLTKTRGTLDAAGKGSASFNIPKTTNSSAIGVKFYHAYLAYDAKNNFYMASNPVTLTLMK